MTNEELLAAIDARFSAFAAQVDARFNAFAAQVDARFSTFAAQVDARFDSLEARMDRLETDVRAAFVQIEQLHVKTDKIAEAMALLDEKVEGFRHETGREFENMRSLNAAAFASIQGKMNIYDQRLGLS